MVRVLRWVAGLLSWLLLTLLIASAIFLSSEKSVVVASHDTVVRPTLDGTIVLHSGPLLPDLRLPSGRAIGVDLILGKTEAPTTEALFQRYAFIASHPEGQVATVDAAVRELAISALVRGAVLAAVPFGLWLLLGANRRTQLVHALTTRGGVLVVGAVLVAAVLVVQPWRGQQQQVEDDREWTPLADVVDVTLPPELADVEITTDVTSTETRRLVESAIATYQNSRDWYAAAAEAAADLELRQPEEDDTVVIVVADRHDNVGMDQVARAIGDAGGATAVFDAGDDTSTGATWEAFSLDSLDEAFADYNRYAVSGNHDHGDFVNDYLEDLGWTHLKGGDPVDGPGGVRLWGVDDPRSSGLGAWRDEPGASFTETEQRVADEVCASEERVGTVLVHDANLGREALRRGCADLVVGGHVHVRSGPTAVVGENGEVGYTFTAGTTGGAAYAIAVGSKPKRAAEVTLLTFTDGRPAGIQWVVLQTNGVFEVGEYVPLTFEPPES